MDTKRGKFPRKTENICSNKFLAEEFRLVHYEVNIEIHDDDSFSYAEDTVLQIKGQDEPFHHKDSNTLHRVSWQSARFKAGV